MPKKAVLAQYAPLEWPAVLLAARARRWLATRRSFSEEYAVLSMAIEFGWEIRRAGHRTLLNATIPPLGDLRVMLRRGTSDFAVFQQCLVEQHYRLAAFLAEQRFSRSGKLTIIDGGANVGLSALYFSRFFPNARVWCIEPDPGNHASCTTNLAENGVNNAQVFREALWSGSARLELRRDHRDGRSWSTAVAVALAGGNPESGVAGVGMSSLLSRLGVEKVELLKLDIEGAEEELFADPESVGTWIPRVEVIALEVHRSHGRGLVMAALERYGFRVLPYGELLVGARHFTADDLLRASVLAMKCDS